MICEVFLCTTLQLTDGDPGAEDNERVRHAMMQEKEKLAEQERNTKEQAEKAKMMLVQVRNRRRRPR